MTEREDLDYDINEQFDDDEEVEDRIVANVEEVRMSIVI